MKKLLALLLSSALSLGVLTACKDNSPEETKESANTISYKIGVLQLAEHPSLNLAYEGFVEGLKENGIVDGENLKLDFQNASGDQTNCISIADKLVNDGSNLILAIATPAAQAVASKTTTIPLLCTAVTDFESAKLTEKNISGTSDMAPVENEMKLITELFPEAKTVAMLYSSSEANSKLQVDLAKGFCEEMGLEAVEKTVSNTNDLNQIVQSLKGKCDVIWVPTDNTVVSGMATVTMIATELGIPVVASEENSVSNGAIAAHSLDYFELGKQTAVMASKILKDGANPSDMPVEFLKETKLVINKAQAEKLGVEIPEEMLEKANLI